MTAGEIIGEPLLIHRLTQSKGEYEEKVKELMTTVGLSPAMMERYPHEFSGGQRQRIGVARALSVRPDLIVCDEPVSALDVSIQAQIINLLEELQEKFNLTYLFIAHDLAVVRHISNRIAVMYLGEIVEIATRKDLYRHPFIPIPNLCFRQSRFLIRLWKPSGIMYFWRERCPAPLTRPPAASFIRDVRSPNFLAVGKRNRF